MINYKDMSSKEETKWKLNTKCIVYCLLDPYRAHPNLTKAHYVLKSECLQRQVATLIP